MFFGFAGVSGAFAIERALVAGAQCMVSKSRGFFYFRSGRCIVASETLARAFDRATIRSGGVSALRECAERQYCESFFHPISFAGETTSSPIMARSIASIRA